MSNAKAVTTDTFDADVLKSERTVLVDFWAEWCGPCKAVAPILDEISVEHADKLDIVKLNVDENSQVAVDAGVTSIPSLMVYQGGQVVKTIIGAKPKGELLAELADFI